MATASLPCLTPQQYLEIERAADFKGEYFDGQMFAMAGGTYIHAALIADFSLELGLRLRGKSCRSVSSDLRVRTGSDRFYTYPDIVVICGKPEFADDRKDTLLNPTLLVEVLSDSTEGKDRGFKFHEYQAIESLKEYVLVSQNDLRVEVFRRTSSTEWQLSQYTGGEAIARFASLDCEIPLADIYREVESA